MYLIYMVLIIIHQEQQDLDEEVGDILDVIVGLAASRA